MEPSKQRAAIAKLAKCTEAVAPDYLNDRTAMVNAIQDLSTAEKDKFAEKLGNIMLQTYGEEYFDKLSDGNFVLLLITIPALMLAETYLRAKNAWE